MVTDNCIGTGLPLRVAGRYFHWRTASTRTSPSRCCFFAINGYSGKTADTEIGCVDAAADCLFVCAAVTVGEAKVTSPGNVPRLAVASWGRDWGNTTEAGGWLTAAVSLLRAGLEVMRRYDALPTAR